MDIDINVKDWRGLHTSAQQRRYWAGRLLVVCIRTYIHTYITEELAQLPMIGTRQGSIPTFVPTGRQGGQGGQRCVQPGLHPK